MVENICNICNKKMSILSKKFYAYFGKSKGSLEITEEKIICSQCAEKYRKSITKNFNENLEFTKLKLINKDLAKALEKLNEIFDENDLTHWYNKGNTLLDMDRLEEALNCYDEALFIDTHYTKAWFRKGQTLGYLNSKKIEKDNFGDLDKLYASLRCFENVIELEKNKKTQYPRDGWEYAASFMMMLTLSFIQYWLYKKNTPSESIDKELIKAINKWVPILSFGIQINKKQESNPFWLGGVINEDSYPNFQNMCTENMDRILAVFSPPEQIGSHIFGDKH
jgi:tetratricopeptide (TPR) repeat protein